MTLAKAKWNYSFSKGQGVIQDFSSSDEMPETAPVTNHLYHPHGCHYDFKLLGLYVTGQNNYIQSKHFVT